MNSEEKRNSIIIFFWSLSISICVFLYLSDLLYVASENQRVLFSLNTDEASHVQLLMHAYRESEFLSIHSYGHLYFNLSLLVLEFIDKWAKIDDRMIIVVLRTVSFSSYFLAIFAAGLVANRVLTLGFSMVSVLCFGVIPLDFVRYAFISHPDVLQIALLNFSILLFCQYLKTKSNKSLYISFALCGMAFSTKYSGLFLIIIFFFWIFAVERRQAAFENSRNFAGKILRFGGIVISIAAFLALSNLTVDMLVGVVGSRNAITDHHVDFFNSLIFLSKVIVGLTILVCAIDRLWGVVWYEIYNNSGVLKATYGSVIFFVSFAIFSPGLIPNMRFLRGMAAESVHVSFGHTFRDHGSPLEWLKVLSSVDLLGIPFGIFFALFFSIALYKAAAHGEKSNREILFQLSWVVLVVLYCVFKVNYREPRYLLVVMPSLIIIAFWGAQNAIPPVFFKERKGLNFSRIFFFMFASVVALYGVHTFKKLKSDTLGLASEHRIEFFSNWLDEFCVSDVRVAYVPYVYVPSSYGLSKWNWVWGKDELMEFSPDVIILSKHYIETFSDPLKAEDYFFGRNSFQSAKDAIYTLNEKFKATPLLDGEYIVFYSKIKCMRDGTS